MLETQQFAPTQGSPLRRSGAYEPQPAGFQSTDTGPTESPSKPLPDQGATRKRFPEFADEPQIWPWLSGRLVVLAHRDSAMAAKRSTLSCLRLRDPAPQACDGHRDAKQEGLKSYMRGCSFSKWVGHAWQLPWRDFVEPNRYTIMRCCHTVTLGLEYGARWTVARYDLVSRRQGMGTPTSRKDGMRSGSLRNRAD